MLARNSGYEIPRIFFYNLFIIIAKAGKRLFYTYLLSLAAWQSKEEK